MKTFALAAAVTALLASPGPTAHFGLQQSLPEADAQVSRVVEVRLRFTQEPQDNSVSVRLIDAGGELVGTRDPVADASDAQSFVLPLEAPLAEGSYTVAWRGIGQDGHVVRGEFGFTVVSG